MGWKGKGSKVMGILEDVEEKGENVDGDKGEER